MADIGEPLRRRRVIPLEEESLPSREEPKRLEPVKPAAKPKKVPV